MIRIERVYLPTETLGSMYDDENLLVKTMELPWLDNKNNISCIPEGIYPIKKMPPGFGRKYWYFRFKFVKGRTINPILQMSSILIHPATYTRHLKGCIGVGKKFHDFDNDGVPDLAESKLALQFLVNTLPNEFDLHIIKKPE